MNSSDEFDVEDCDVVYDISGVEPVPQIRKPVTVIEGWKDVSNKDLNAGGESDDDEGSHNAKLATPTRTNGGGSSCGTNSPSVISVASSRASLEQSVITGLFNLNGNGEPVDLILDDTTLSWTNAGDDIPSTGKKKKSPMKYVIELKGVYCTRIRRVKSPQQRQKGGATQLQTDGACQGFEVHTYVSKGNKLRLKTWLFQHPSTDLCRKFVSKINAYLEGLTHRPRKIKFFLQPHAGTKDGSSLFTKYVRPILDTAGVDVWYEEVFHNEAIKQKVIHTDFNEFDCIAVMGGDGSACKLINAVLNKTQSDNGINVKPGFKPVSNKIPVAIIPCGLTNHVVSSIQGVSDITTATINMVLGFFMKIDVNTIFSMDKFICWSLNSHYGFYGNIQAHRSKFTHLYGRQIELAYLKALTHRRFRSYECRIKYLPSPVEDKNDPYDGKVCHHKCSICVKDSNNTDDAGDDGSPEEDELIELDPFAQSGSSSIITDLKNTPEPEWKTARGSYVDVGVLTVSGRCDMAPRGFSKTAHLADGYMDLVLVQGTNRKSFLKFLKRHGNSKNQFEYPFIEVHRVKEVKFKQTIETTWQHKDQSYNEIEQQMANIRIKKLKKAASMDVIDSIPQIDDKTSDSDDDDDDDDDSITGVNSTGLNSETGSVNGDKEDKPTLRKRRLSITSFFKKSRRASTPAAPPSGLPKGPPPRNRISLLDRETFNRKLRREKKERKRKEKEESRSKSQWSVDNEIIADDGMNTDLHFIVQPRLLNIVGDGIHDIHVPDDNLRYLFLSQV